MKKNLLVTLLCCFALVFIFSSAVFAEVDESGKEFTWILHSTLGWVKGYPAENNWVTIRDAAGNILDSKDWFIIFDKDGNILDAIRKDAIEKTSNDLDPNAWYYTALTALKDANIIKGYEDGKILPNANITRAEFVTMLARLDGVDVTQYTSHPFIDAPAEWYKSYIAWAYAEGITNGVTDTAFAPNVNITREAMMVMIARYVEKVYWELPYIDLGAFRDGADISSWAIDAIYGLRSIGLVEGERKIIDNKKVYYVTPKALSTRAEAGTVLYRVMNYEWE